MAAADDPGHVDPDHAYNRLRRIAIALFWSCLAMTAVATAVCVRLVAADFSVLQPALLAGAVAFAGAVFLHACLTFSVRAALVLAGLTCTVSFVAETAGQWWGIPFGARYAYHPQFVPAVGGVVPVFVLLAWFVLSYGPLVALRSLVVTRNGRTWSRGLVKSLACSAGLTTSDLFLDPLAVGVGAWCWDGGGVYFGVPLTNYAGWLATGLVIYVPFVALGLDRARTNPPTRNAAAYLDRPLVATGLVLQAMALAITAAVTGSLVPVLVTFVAKGPYLRRVCSPFRRRAPAVATPALGDSADTCR